MILRENVRAVEVTGQMHGLIMLNRSLQALTPLITWQDQRCDSEFLERLGQRTGRSLSSGYGCATLAWLLEHGQMPAGAVTCATIQDYLAAQVCGLPEVVTDPTDGASWGLFDIVQRTWDEDAVVAAGIAPSLLPRVVECGTAIGRVGAGWAQKLAIPAGNYFLRYGFTKLVQPLMEITLAESEQKVIDLDQAACPVPSDSYLRVNVVGDNGVPMTGVKVYLTGNNQTLEPFYTGGGFGYILAGPAGDYLLHVEFPGYQRTSQKVTLAPSSLEKLREASETMLIRLQKSN